MSAHAEFSVGQVLPHAGRMLLLDELLEIRDDGVSTAVTIHGGSTFCDGDRGVPAWVGLEYMAQTACAFSGIEEARAGRAASISLLLGSRGYRTAVPFFPVGTRLVVAAHLQLRDEHDLAVFSCTIHDAADGRELAAGDIKAIRPRDLAELIRRQHEG